MRHIGVDLHPNSLTVCYLEAGKDEVIKTFKMDELEVFKGGLEKTDEVAVEATGNTTFFYEHCKDLVAEVIVVAPRQFKVIQKSVSKTDKKDARALAFYLSKGMLPRARVKEKGYRDVASLVESRDKLVKLRTVLLNKIHGLLNGEGIKLKKESLGGKKGLARAKELARDELVKVEIEILISQIESLGENIKKFEAVIEVEAAKLEGYENVMSIKGIGVKSAAILLSAIGNIDDFEDESKLCAYFGLVPRVSNSNETEKSGRITKRGSKLVRTTLVQCAQIAKRYSPYVGNYFERIKARKGFAKAIIATARKLLTIVYKTLKNKWVFEDFPNFLLKPA